MTLNARDELLAAIEARGLSRTDALKVLIGACLLMDMAPKFRIHAKHFPVLLAVTAGFTSEIADDVTEQHTVSDLADLMQLVYTLSPNMQQEVRNEARRSSPDGG